MSDKNKNRITSVRISVRTDIKSLHILNSIEKYEVAVGFRWKQLFIAAKKTVVDAEKFQVTSLRGKIAFPLSSKISDYIDRTKTKDGTYYVKIVKKQKLPPVPLERVNKTSPQLRRGKIGDNSCTGNWFLWEQHNFCEVANLRRGSAIDVSSRNLDTETRIGPGPFGGSLPYFELCQKPNVKLQNLASHPSLPTRRRGRSDESGASTLSIKATISKLASASIPTKLTKKSCRISDDNTGQTSRFSETNHTTNQIDIMDEDIADFSGSIEDGDDEAIRPDDSISQVSEALTQMDHIPSNRGLTVSPGLKDKILAKLAERTDPAIWTTIFADLKEFRNHPKSWKNFSTSCPTLSSILVEILLDLATG